MNHNSLSTEQQDALALAQEKMAQDQANPTAIKVFTSYFQQLAEGATGLIPEESITPLTQAEEITEFSQDPKLANQALGKTVFLKLNGGLGTSMGLAKAKSLLPVRGGQTFLDLIFAQIRAARLRSGSEIPLLLMNSFRTRNDCRPLFPADLQVKGLPVDFLQGRVPKLAVSDLSPISWPENPELEWCPPGHGDVFTSLHELKILDTLLDAGYRYLANSNSDNLGASPSADLAGWFATSGASFAAEVCRRTTADRKGGHLAIRKSDNQLILRDTAQTPNEDMPFFTDEHLHCYFNTNNLWFNIEALRDLLRNTDGVVGLPMIRNQKTVDPTRNDSPSVYQLESASGAIIERFSDSQAIVVPRSRFLPVKTTNDLFLLRSDAYDLTSDFELVLNRENAPLINLDPRYFALIEDFSARVNQVPSLTKVESLTVNGNYTFTGSEQLQGNVTLES